MQTLNHTQAVQRLASLAALNRRVMLGIVGPPGAGKTTLAARLHTTQAALSQLLPMDGFHLANEELVRLGRRQRKGAPDTFDVLGYVSLLQRIRQQTADEVIYAPNFDRTLDASIASCLPVFHSTQLIIAEGNYLAHDQHGWQAVLPLLDEVWYVDVDPALRVQRLIARHVEFGKTPEYAAQWEQQTDAPNALLIEATRHRTHYAIVEIETA